jgi:predicted ATPase
MYISKINIQNFKSFKDVTVTLNPDLNIFVGINNAGKTTILEAIALWQECFEKIIHKATKNNNKGRVYKKDDFILGHSDLRHFPFDDVNSVRSPNFEDIFYQQNQRSEIFLSATLSNIKGESIEIAFSVKGSGLNYVIDSIAIDIEKFNRFFQYLPTPFNIFYASPVATIRQSENFVTEPQIRSQILHRASATVLRNRLYKLYADPVLFPEFVKDISYILYDNQKQLIFSIPSNIQRDTRVIVNVEIGNKDTPKDIALLGSGTLQVIECLLNFYAPINEQKDLNIVLLDEPDSYLHRNIQTRLLGSLIKFAKNSQIFIATHNETLIRSSDPKYIFHLEGKAEKSYQSIGNQGLSKQHPHFSGIMPSPINQVIRAIGQPTGLDFVNAMEADKLIFVEGEDDALRISRLLRVQKNAHQNYMFWVLGGIDNCFGQIQAYKTVFSTIRNGASLWEKSILIIDSDDRITDTYKADFEAKLAHSLGIKTKVWNAYTFESILFMNIPKTAILFAEWLKKQTTQDIPNDLETQIFAAYAKIGLVVENRTQNPSDAVFIRNKNLQNTLKKNFKIELIKQDASWEHTLSQTISNDFKKYLNNKMYYKLMTKIDVEIVFNEVLAHYTYDFTFHSERDFDNLFDNVSIGTWIDEWDFLLTI